MSSISNNNNKQDSLYFYNKEAVVGDSITCPVCNTTFTKKQYSQAFCCKDCKDKFWNKRGDRHKENYYHEYNKKHPERCHYIKQIRQEFGNLYYDSLGRAYSKDFYNPTLTDMINQREYGTWHDDDWYED